MKSKPTTSAAPAVTISTAIPRAFNAQKLSEYLGVPRKTIGRMGFNKVIVSPKTHIYLQEDVLARLEELKRGGVK